MEEEILYKRVGVSLSPTGVFSPNIPRSDVIYSSWPFAKLRIYKTKLILEAPFQGKIIIPYRSINFIEKVFGAIRIHHNIKNLQPFLFIHGSGNGMFLFKRIKEAINNNHLPLKLK
jgi:hypothetical protein